MAKKIAHLIVAAKWSYHAATWYCGGFIYYPAKESLLGKWRHFRYSWRYQVREVRDEILAEDRRRKVAAWKKRQEAEKVA